MPRKPRLIMPGYPLHLIQRGNNRSACFYANEDYCRYLDHLQGSEIGVCPLLFRIRKLKHLLYLVLASLLSGCGQYSVRNIDKPPPEDYEIWTKDNQTELQTKKSLLECGAIAPSTLGWPYKDAYKKIGVSSYNEQMNKYFLIGKCMENAGYRKKFGMRSSQEGCNDPAFPERKKYPACQVDAEIPTPSAERRLNSWYCKVKSDYEYCLEHALAPKLCSREKVVNPPPECLPPGQEYKSSSAENQPERKWE